MRYLLITILLLFAMPVLAVDISVNIGTRTSEEGIISSVTGNDAGIFTLTLSAGANANIDVYDKLIDSASNSYHITAIANNIITAEDRIDAFTTPATGLFQSPRMYSTLTLWEADLDNLNLYSSSADAYGYVYNDSTYDESVTIDGGTTIPLNSITLTVPSGERHNGTAGSGAQILMSSGATAILDIDVAITIEWLEIDGNEQAGYYGVTQNAGTVLANTIIHSIYRGGNWPVGILQPATGNDTSIQNTIIYDIKNTLSNSGGGAYGVYFQTGTGPDLYNCTIHNIHCTKCNGEVINVKLADSGAKVIKNVIATDPSNGTGSGSEECFDPASPSTITMDYNLSSDATASGANSLTNKSSSDQFVSTAGGSENLHLKTGADAIEVGTDLATTPTGVNYDIDNVDRNHKAGILWSMGAHQKTTRTTIGTTSRDYSTIQAWEDELDDTDLYSANSIAIGEMYDDSDFDEAVTFDNGETVGLNSIKLTVPSAERHNGTAGSGAQMLMSINRAYAFKFTKNIDTTVEWFEVDCNGKDVVEGVLISNELDVNVTEVFNIRNNIIHDSVHTQWTFGVWSAHTWYTQTNITNNIIYDFESSTATTHEAFGIYESGQTGATVSINIQNNTVHNISNSNGSDSGNPTGIQWVDDASRKIENNVVTDTSGNGTPNDFVGTVVNATANTNASSDSTAPDPIATEPVASGTEFVSTTGGSENLHLKTGAECIDAGTDLGDVAAAIDIDNRNRHDEGDTWDIGADELVAAAAEATERIELLIKGVLNIKGNWYINKGN
jgi:hypothetical protein